MTGYRFQDSSEQRKLVVAQGAPAADNCEQRAWWEQGQLWGIAVKQGWRWRCRFSESIAFSLIGFVFSVCERNRIKEGQR